MLNLTQEARIPQKMGCELRQRKAKLRKSVIWTFNKKKYLLSLLVAGGPLADNHLVIPQCPLLHLPVVLLSQLLHPEDQAHRFLRHRQLHPNERVLLMRPNTIMSLSIKVKVRSHCRLVELV
jgi:hypothetical protein